MLTIRKKDVQFGEKISIIFDVCQARCIFGDIYTCEGCIFTQFLDKMTESDFLFSFLLTALGNLKEYYGPKPLKKDFLKFLLQGGAIIYSANQRELPAISEGLFNKVLIRAQRHPQRFFSRARKKLFQLHPYWLNSFAESCEKVGITGYFFNLIIAFLILLIKAEEAENWRQKTIIEKSKIKALPPPRNTIPEGDPEQLHSAILTYLASQRGAP